MFLLTLKNGDLIDPYKIESISCISEDKRLMTMQSGAKFEITKQDVDHIEHCLSEDLALADAKRELLEEVCNFIHRYARKHGI